MQGKSNENTDPEHATTETTLARCLVDGDTATKARDRRRRGKALGISFAIESIVLALLLVAPLMTSVAQPQLEHIFPPLPIVMRVWHTHNPSQEPAPRTIHHQLTFPVRDLQPPLLGPVLNSHKSADPGNVSEIDFPGEYIPGAIQLPGIGPTRSPIEPPSIETHKTNEKSIVKVSEGVQQAQLTSRFQPRYPPLALQTRKEGTVVLHAIISRDGRITALEVVSGSPWFDQAALDAVRQWRYRPTYLGGEPVEVETTITVIFRLSQ
jgi:protein TonB